MLSYLSLSKNLRPQLKTAILKGGVPFDMVHGMNTFEYPRVDSRFNQLFQTALVHHSTLVIKKVLECYKGFENINTLVDVGGGFGTSLSLITSKYPHIKGINFDLPHVIQDALPCSGMLYIINYIHKCYICSILLCISSENNQH